MRRLFVVWAIVAACQRRAPGGEAAPTVNPEARSAAAPAVPFEVRAEGGEVMFQWFDERGGGHFAQRAGEVPEARRAMVRVDPTQPAQRAPGWVYVADLRAPSPRGTYPVRAVSADVFSAEVRALAGVREAPGTPLAPPPPPAQVAQAGGAHGAPSPSPQGPGVIVYGASWCSACHSAAGWLRAHNVPFVEKDIEQDPGAQQEMMAKAQRAGVPTGSIPILDVRGRILVGFSPPDIERALAGG